MFSVFRTENTAAAVKLWTDPDGRCCPSSKLFYSQGKILFKEHKLLYITFVSLLLCFVSNVWSEAETDYCWRANIVSIWTRASHPALTRVMCAGQVVIISFKFPFFPSSCPPSCLPLASPNVANTEVVRCKSFVPSWLHISPSASVCLSKHWGKAGLW